jgi:hypothetical protein
MGSVDTLDRNMAKDGEVIAVTTRVIGGIL